MAAPKHVVDAPEKITDYINALPGWSKKICQRLRELILKSDPKIIEDWKWGPNYYCEGMVCGYAAFQKHVNLAFFKGALLKDKRKLFEPNAEGVSMRSFKFTDAKQLDEDTLLEYVISAIDLNKKKKTFPANPLRDKTIIVKPGIKKEFRLAGVLSYFESLAYSHKKEYIRWIEDAKKEETRLNRISKTIIMLGKKETMHAKYKK